MNKKKSPFQDDREFAHSIAELIKSTKELANQAYQNYYPEVETVIRKNIHDSHQIEHLLDGILDFCFDPNMLQLFKRLCRYYYPINPDATVFYVQTYRDMWDESTADERQLS